MSKSTFFAFFFILSWTRPLFATIDLRGDSLDVIRTSLHLDFTSFSAKVLFARADLHVQSKVPALSSMTFDLEGLMVDSVRHGEQICSFIQSARSVRVFFPVLLNPSDTLTISFWYHGQPLQNTGDFGGFYWTNQYAFNIGVSFLSQPHNYGRVWFPCFDNFTERSFFSFSVKTLPQHKAFCNGTLTGHTIQGGFPVWEWSLTPSVPSYLASVAVSAYTTHIDSCDGLNGAIPVQLAASVADSADLASSFIHLQNAVTIFESRFGPYRWERLGYCVVPFNAGAMEHATNIAYMQGVVNGNTDYETLMAHELSHHWFGNLVTCDKAEEMWLNEGWAVFCEHIFLEGLYGQQAYKDAVKANHSEVMQFAHVEDSGFHALNLVPQSFTYGPTVYKKGADVVHTLRTYMGDSLFFSCLQSFLDTYLYQDFNSEKLKQYLYQCSGSNMVLDFFRDWVEQPGFAHFRIERFEWSQQQLRLTVRQRLRQANHLFRGVPLDITVWNTQGIPYTERIIWDSPDSCASFLISLPPGHDVAWLALDFHEKLSDAVTDDWKKIGSQGNYIFSSARCQLQVNQISDSAFIRAEHHWVAPEPFYQPLSGLHLSDNRYWTLDGSFPVGLNFNLRLDFNGSQNANGWLDNTFITQSEDSLVLLYRPDPLAEWTFADSFTVFKQGSATNKIGYIMAYGAKKGDYAMAIWDHLRPTISRDVSTCPITQIKEDIPLTFELYPVPAHHQLMLRLPYVAERTFELRSVQGMLVDKKNSADVQFTWDIHRLSKGTYLMTIHEGKRYVTRMFQVE